MLKQKVNAIQNPMILKYVQGLLDIEKKRVETAMVIEQHLLARARNQTSKA